MKLFYALQSIAFPLLHTNYILQQLMRIGSDSKPNWLQYIFGFSSKKLKKSQKKITFLIKHIPYEK